MYIQLLHYVLVFRYEIIDDRNVALYRCDVGGPLRMYWSARYVQNLYKTKHKINKIKTRYSAYIYNCKKGKICFTLP